MSRRLAGRAGVVGAAVRRPRQQRLRRRPPHPRQRLRRDRQHLDTQIDAIEQRPRQARLVAPDLLGRKRRDHRGLGARGYAPHRLHRQPRPVTKPPPTPSSPLRMPETAPVPASAQAQHIMTTTLGVALLLTAGATLYKVVAFSHHKHAIDHAARLANPALATRPRHWSLPVLMGAVIGTLVTFTSVGAGAVGVTVLDRKSVV